MLMTKPTPYYLVWVRGLGGPAPEVWRAYENKDSHGNDKKTVLEKYEIKDEWKDLKLEQLEMMYPYKGEK